jgi:hypothetical protein
MRGFADIHNHQFANHFMGGYVVAGKPYGSVQASLSPSECRLDRNGGHSLNHGTDILGGFFAGLSGPAYYGHDGWPQFGGWPAHFEAAHQKVHQDFLRRAVDGGLRLIVMLAVESHKGCQAVANGGGRTDGRSCTDEMTSIYRQIEDAKNMQRDR